MSDGKIHGSRSEDIIHFSLFNVGEGVDGDGVSGYRFQTRSSPSHHPGDLVRALGFYSYGNYISGHRYHTRQLHSYTHGRLYSVHPRFPQ